MTTPNLSGTERHAIGLLNKATDYLIRYGQFILVRRGHDFLSAKLIEEFPVQMWVRPMIHEEGHLALFRIKMGGYYFRIEAIHTERLHEVDYEHWVTHVTAQDYVTPLRGCIFHIASVRKVEGGNPAEAKRDILKRETTFIPEYRTEGGDIFRLPLSDPRVLFALQAWEYPACFAGTDLPLTEVVAEPGGTYSMRPAR